MKFGLALALLLVAERSSAFSLSTFLAAPSSCPRSHTVATTTTTTTTAIQAKTNGADEPDNKDDASDNSFPVNENYVMADDSYEVDEQTRAYIQQQVEKRAQALKVEYYDLADDIRRELGKTYQVAIDDYFKYWYIRRPLNQIDDSNRHWNTINQAQRIIANPSAEEAAKQQAKIDQRLAERALEQERKKQMEKEKQQQQKKKDSQTPGVVEATRLDKAPRKPPNKMAPGIVDAEAREDTDAVNPGDVYVMAGASASIDPDTKIYIQDQVEKRAQALANNDIETANDIQDALGQTYRVAIDDYMKQWYIPIPMSMLDDSNVDYNGDGASSRQTEVMDERAEMEAKKKKYMEEQMAKLRGQVNGQGKSGKDDDIEAKKKAYIEEQLKKRADAMGDEGFSGNNRNSDDDNDDQQDNGPPRKSFIEEQMEKRRARESNQGYPGGYGGFPNGAFGQMPNGAYGPQPNGAYGQMPNGAYGQQPNGAYGQQPNGAFGQQPNGAYGINGSSGPNGVNGSKDGPPSRDNSSDSSDTKPLSFIEEQMEKRRQRENDKWSQRRQSPFGGGPTGGYRKEPPTNPTRNVGAQDDDDKASKDSDDARPMSFIEERMEQRRQQQRANRRDVQDYGDNMQGYGGMGSFPEQQDFRRQDPQAMNYAPRVGMNSFSAQDLRRRAAGMGSYFPPDMDPRMMGPFPNDPRMRGQNMGNQDFGDSWGRRNPFAERQRIRRAMVTPADGQPRKLSYIEELMAKRAQAMASGDNDRLQNEQDLFLEEQRQRQARAWGGNSNFQSGSSRAKARQIRNEKNRRATARSAPDPEPDQKWGSMNFGGPPNGGQSGPGNWQDPRASGGGPNSDPPRDNMGPSSSSRPRNDFIDSNYSPSGGAAPADRGPPNGPFQGGFQNGPGFDQGNQDVEWLLEKRAEAMAEADRIRNILRNNFSLDLDGDMPDMPAGPGNMNRGFEKKGGKGKKSSSNKGSSQRDPSFKEPDRTNGEDKTPPGPKVEKYTMADGCKWVEEATRKHIEDEVAKRSEAMANGDFLTADRIRDRLSIDYKVAIDDHYKYWYIGMSLDELNPF